jgi:hypothetical protein
MTQLYDLIVWPAEAFALFIAFTVHGAMWRGAEDHGSRGWAVALTWAVGSTLVLNAIHLLHDGLVPHR